MSEKHGSQPLKSFEKEMDKSTDSASYVPLARLMLDASGESGQDPFRPVKAEVRRFKA